MTVIAKKPQSLTDVPMHYCPGCGHGIVHRLMAEAIDELGITDRVIGVAPVGCAVFADSYFACDMIQGAHGRGPAIATGIKRSRPDAIVFSYQGDGDLASIGMAEIVHAAARSEHITVTTELDDKDRADLERIVKQYCTLFSASPEAVFSEPFTKLIPTTSRPYANLYTPN